MRSRNSGQRLSQWRVSTESCRRRESLDDALSGGPSPPDEEVAQVAVADRRSAGETIWRLHDFASLQKSSSATGSPATKWIVACGGLTVKSSFVLLLMAIVAAAPASSRATTFYLDSVRENDFARALPESVPGRHCRK
jgi:hypothetical protein